MSKEKRLYFITGKAERGSYFSFLDGRPASDIVNICGFFRSVNDKYAEIQTKKRYKKTTGLSCDVYALTKITPSKVKEKMRRMSGKRKQQLICDKEIIFLGVNRNGESRWDFLYVLSLQGLKRVDIKKYQIYQRKWIFAHNNFPLYNRRIRRIPMLSR